MMGERDQLYALFAETLGYVPVEDVLGLAERRERDADAPPFRELLRQAGGLSDDALVVVDALVKDALGRNRDDAAMALTSLPPSLRERLTKVSVTVRSDPGRHLSELDDEDISTPGTAPAGDARFIPVETPGRYRTALDAHGHEEELGRGGAGRVILAKDRLLGRDVAIKELLPQLAEAQKKGTPQSLRIEEGFLREARITGQLEHPAVVPVYDLARRADGTLCYTMQRVRGRTLSQALADAGSLEARLAFLPDLLVVSRAVAAAHHRGVVHRDLKPQNVMLGAFGATFLMDWGLAIALDGPPKGRKAASPADARTQAPLGTPSYMSPEQAGGGAHPVDRQSDVWGLGAMLFEVLTGRAPYVGGSVFDVLTAVRTGRDPNPAALEPRAPPELLAICAKALKRDRAHRYPSALAFADDLAAFLEDRRVTVYRYSVGEVLERLWRRHRALGVAVLAAAVGLGVTGVGAFTQLRRERDEAATFAALALDEVSDSLQNAPGAAPLVDQLMKSSLEVYARQLDLAKGPRADVLRLGRAVWRVGFVTWQQGRFIEARAAFQHAKDAADALEARFPEDAPARALGVRSRVGLADVQAGAGKAGEALAALRDVLPRAEALVAAAPANIEALDALAMVHSRSAGVLLNAGRAAEALAAIEPALQVRERRRALMPHDAQALEKLAFDQGVQGLALLDLGRRDEARGALTRGVASADEAFRASGLRSTRATRANVLQDLGRLELEAGRLEACRAVEARAMEDFEAALEVDPRNLTNRWLAAEAELMLGEPQKAWVHARFLEGTPSYDGFVALVALAAGKDDAAKRAASGTTDFAAEHWFVQAVLAELDGRPAGAAAALRAAAGPQVDLTVLVPWAASLRRDEGPAMARVRGWTARLLARPRTQGELKAELLAIASELDAGGGR